MTGLGILLRKEGLEAWRTLRLPVVLVLFAFVGLLSPLLARYLPEIIELAAGDQLGPIVLPPPTVADAVDQLARNLGQFGALTAVLLGATSVASEKERGTAAFVVSKPVSRAAFLLAKVGVLGGVLALGCTLSVALAAVYTAVLFEPVSPLGWVGFGVAAWVSLSAFAALSFLASVVARSATVALGLGVGALLLLSLLVVIPTVGALTPAALLQNATQLVSGSGESSPDLVGGLVVGVGTVFVLLLAATWAFQRQELT